MTAVAQRHRHLPGRVPETPPRQVRRQRTAGIVHPPTRLPVLRLVPKVLCHDFPNPLQGRTRSQPPQLGNPRIVGTFGQPPSHPCHKTLRTQQQSTDGGAEGRGGRFSDTRLEELPVGSPCFPRIACELPQHLRVGHPRHRLPRPQIATATAPRVLLRPLNHLGPHGVQVDVAADLQEVALLLD